MDKKKRKRTQSGTRVESGWALAYLALATLVILGLYQLADIAISLAGHVSAWFAGR
jgi:hypothetical protein